MESTTQAQQTWPTPYRQSARTPDNGASGNLNGSAEQNSAYAVKAQVKGQSVGVNFQIPAALRTGCGTVP
jgi:hypothetical protein